MSRLVRPEALRQSHLARFDQCALSLKLALQSPEHQPSDLAARGTLFHRWVARALEMMREQGENNLPVEVGLELLRQVVDQRDVSDDEVVHIPMREHEWLRVAVTTWCERGVTNVQRVQMVEQRLSADIEVRNNGTSYMRTITGRPDVLVADPPDGVIVLDWKAQPIDAKVLTPSGWRMIGGLRADDHVIGSSGRPVEVRGVYPQGRKEIYEVEFMDGGTTQCCDDHLWTVRWSGGPLVVRPLSEIRRMKSRLAVPAVGPVHFDELAHLPVHLPIAPYLLGLLLGDGTLRARGAVSISTTDPELVMYAAEAVPAGTTVTYEDRCTWNLTTPGRTPNPTRRALRSLGLLGKRSHEKHVPERYLYASVSDRLSLLRGLMDTDGFVDREGRMSFSSASRTLAEQVRFLVWSLGGWASLKTWSKAPHRDSHVVYFRMPLVPFRLARKAKRYRRTKASMDRTIRAIRPVGEAETVCIRVAAADGLYVTDDFILTHNTGYKPPAKRIEGKGPIGPTGQVEDRLSEEGYAQQVIYGVLVLRNFPQVERVTLREFYVLHGEYREATVVRWNLERYLDLLGSLVAQVDAAIDAGARSKRWIPTAGTHCAICPQPLRCPIRKHKRIPRDNEDVMRIAREWIVSDERRKVLVPFLKGYVDAHGPIEIQHDKGRRMLGWVPNKSGSGQTFRMYEPDGEGDAS